MKHSYLISDKYVCKQMMIEINQLGLVVPVEFSNSIKFNLVGRVFINQTEPAS